MAEAGLKFSISFPQNVSALPLKMPNIHHWKKYNNFIFTAILTEITGAQQGEIYLLVCCSVTEREF